MCEKWKTKIDFGKAIEDKTKLGWKGYCLKVKPTSNTQEASKNAGRMFFLLGPTKTKPDTHTHTHTTTKKTKQTKQTLK